MTPKNALGSVPNNLETAVTGITYSTYTSDSESNSSGKEGVSTIPVVYVTFANGNVCVICLQTNNLLAFSISEEYEDKSGLQSVLRKRVTQSIPKKNINNLNNSINLNLNSSNGHDNINVAEYNNKNNNYDHDIHDTDDSDNNNFLKNSTVSIVVDSLYQEIKIPLYQANYQIQKTEFNGEEILHLKFISIILSNSNNVTCVKNESEKNLESLTQDLSEKGRIRSNSEINNSPSNKNQSNQTEGSSPRYLLVPLWNSLMTCDISKFCKLSLVVNRTRRSFSMTSYNPTEEAEQVAEVS